MRLFPHMTVEENVAFPLKMQGVSRAGRLEQARDLLEKVQMGGFRDRRPSELSGGQQQRAALARPWRPGPGSCSWTSPFLPWTKISERICGILSFSYSGNSI